MPLDAISLRAVVEELRPRMLRLLLERSYAATLPRPRKRKQP